MLGTLARCSVLTFRPTKMLAARTGLFVAPGEVPVELPHCDWCAHTFMAQRYRYVILTNTHSFLSVVFSSRGVTDETTFIQAALRALKQSLTESGREFAFERLIAPHANEARFAPIPNRAVLGTMNELIYQAQLDLIEGGMSPLEVTGRLGKVPLSVLWKKGEASHPAKAFDRMPARVGGTFG